MPAAGIETVVVGDIVPIVEIAGSILGQVFMVSNGRVGDGTELPEIGEGVPYQL